MIGASHCQTRSQLLNLSRFFSLWISSCIFLGAITFGFIPPVAALQPAYMVADFPGDSNPRDLTAVGEMLYYEASGGLWKSDGTVPGTTLIVNFSDLSIVEFDEPTELNGILLFEGYHSTQYGHELWRSDGTAAGTVMVKDIDPSGHSYPTGLVNIRGTLYFVANDGSGEKLWKSDGTNAGTVLVSPSGGGLMPIDIIDLGSLILFFGYDATHGRELWKTDGTPAGTAMVAEINPSGDIGYYNETIYLTNVNGTAFFGANDGVHGIELWKSDGTESGTTLVKDVNPSASSSPQNLTDVDGTLFFTAYDGVHGLSPWKSDGSSEGTNLILDVNPSGDMAYYTEHVYFTNVQGTLFFTAKDGVHGWQLWKSDGTVQGTTIVQEINPTGSIVSGPGELTAVGDTLFFSIDDGIHGREPWISDGTIEGTRILQDISPAGASYPREFTVIGELVFFAAEDGTHGRELWALSLSDLTGLSQNTWGDYR